MESTLNIGKLDPTDVAAIQKIAHWYYDEWNTSIEKTVKRLSNQPNRHTLFQLVLTIDNQLIVTGGLCNEVNLFNVHKKYSRFKPWVGLLYTHEDYRNRDYGRLLLNKIEDEAQRLGLAKIYLYTFTAESLYQRCGWKEIDRVAHKRSRYRCHGKILRVMDIYSTLLLIAILLTAVACLATFAQWIRRDNLLFRQTAKNTALICMLASVGALVIHFANGHAPGSDEAMRLGTFIAQHPAPLITIACAAVCFWLAKYQLGNDVPI